MSRLSDALRAGLDRLEEAWERAAPLRGVLSAQAARSRRRPLTWGTVYAALLCVLGVLAIDRPLAWLFKANIGGDVEGFLKVVTRLGEAGLYLVPAGLLWVALMLAALAARSVETAQRLRRLSFVPMFVFAGIAVSGIIGNAVKCGLGRTRPRYLFDQGLYGFEFLNTSWGMNSFPSGHTQAAFAAMTALTLIFPRYDIAFIAIAVLVGASRVLTTVHYFSDAVAGAWLGVTVTVLIHRLLTAKGIDVRVRLERDRRLGE